ncbi:fumarylacetoacetate hydrolase family protein [Luteimicrobium subarcticum]|uniref:2-keto-4-pentenoate hydratase/2-oxohepta-3-ene-1,7-dioic acid hydratase in catechol pathway n=1 Tax=Luteimicrobium subarcticum TaxID=620910 RepID=A0A2M8WJQ7_9MICO|nr:fumarylacetoacetate hydrolase family protein [Luteimicrobium subarcticum]PJI91149.1 2-keto-4-pentenoate hydratase/2-oxohepta-3-ene-1,7-dioic acid hydratase in catechol pathway [Luteimicrobium subarcticum]
MKLAVLDGRTPVVVTEDRAVDVSAVIGVTAGFAGPWGDWLERGHDPGELRDLDLAGLPTVSLDEGRLTAPLARPRKIVAAPVNYLDHKIEMSEQKSVADYGVFLKAGTSVIGPREVVELPYEDLRTDQEGELAVVVGRTARHVTADAALDHVLGYTCGLDISLRSTEDRSTRKSFDTFTPLGPWIVTADEVPDPDALDLRCWVAGELRQETSTSELLFSVRELIAYASSVMTLEPGDVILTGTPAGVGPLRDRDVVRLEIGSVGTLEVTVSGAPAVPYASRPRGRAALAGGAR